ncbi:5'/3'-nucleotidase SurE [Alicyclobacillus kakegawensis]|uniref:5'/3'-nucleotidase SurE n=1 Tax=Alicyclobacillus kakegawensis TaxID=392012 RepID=UPI0009F8F00E
MRILVCNDDGIQAPGIRALAQALADLGEVTVVAPDGQRSASSHAMSLHATIWTERQSLSIPGVQAAYAVAGTPVDCVKWAIAELAAQTPFDLVVSGINQGPNLATDVLYSGTVAAAGEAAVQGIPAVALSLDGPPFPFAEAAAKALQIIRDLDGFAWPADTFLSVNFPPNVHADTKIAVTQLGVRGFRDSFVVADENGERTGYRYTGEELQEPGGEETDVAAVRRGEVSVTPLRYHFTNHQIIDSLKLYFADDAIGSSASPPPVGARAAGAHERVVIGTHACTRTDDLYQLVDFLNRNLKNKDVIFGLSLDKQQPDKMILTLYRA